MDAGLHGGEVGLDFAEARCYGSGDSCVAEAGEGDRVKLIVKPSQLKGEVLIPASKSHTIRALVVATLADGVSEITNPLDSLDTRAAVDACRALGGRITTGDAWQVEGVGGKVAPPADVIDVKTRGRRSTS